MRFLHGGRRSASSIEMTSPRRLRCLGAHLVLLVVVVADGGEIRVFEVYGSGRGGENRTLSLDAGSPRGWERERERRAESVFVCLLPT